jgi:hypothetical protein
MEYKVVSSSSPEGLTIAVNNAINDGWEPIGSHQVVMHHSQNRFSGTQHMDTRHQADYSQTMIRKAKTTIEVDIAFYHPDDENGNVNENEKIYDLEGMLEEYHSKVEKLLLSGL